MKNAQNETGQTNSSEVHHSDFIRHTALITKGLSLVNDLRQETTNPEQVEALEILSDFVFKNLEQNLMSASRSDKLMDII